VFERTRKDVGNNLHVLVACLGKPAPGITRSSFITRKLRKPVRAGWK
jgi:hypothetical protein